MSGELNKKIEELASQETFQKSQASEPAPPNKFDPGGKPIPVVACLYMIYLADKNKKYIRTDEIFGKTKYQFLADYANGFIEALKFFNKCNIDIEGFTKNFSINSIGDLDLTFLAEKVERGGDNYEVVNELIELIAKALSDEQKEADSTENSEESTGE